MDNWTVIVVTCSSSSLAVCVEDEMKCLQKKGIIPASVPILMAEDPAEHMGSGAATVNGLLVAAEYLSAQKSYSVVNADVLKTAQILIIHQGRDFVYSNGGKSLITVPKSWSSIDFLPYGCNYADDVCTNLELLMLFLNKLSYNSPPGVWVCSTDMSIIATNQIILLDWKRISDVVLFSIATDVEYAFHHGCVNTDENGYVANIIYCGSSDVIKQNVNSKGNVAIVSGLIFMSSKVAEELLSLHSIAPLESCTYMGLDSGAEPVQVSLFFDILMAMATKVSREEFMSGKYGKTYDLKAGYSEERLKTMVMGRVLVWKAISRFKMTSVLLENFRYLYWTDQFPAKKFLQNVRSLMPIKDYHSEICVKGNMSISDHLLINSFLNVQKNCTLAAGSTITNSHISASEINVGKNCYLSGIGAEDLTGDMLNIPDGLVVLSFASPKCSVDSILVVFGIEDQFHVPYTDPHSTFVNKPWCETLDCLKVKNDDLWPITSPKNLFNAAIYTAKSSGITFGFLVDGGVKNQDEITKWKNSERFSLHDLLKNMNYNHNLEHKRNVYSMVAAEKVKQILVGNKDTALTPYFRTSFAEGWTNVIMYTLDSILLTERHHAVLTRTLSAMADLLGIMAGKAGGLRSGPGSNKSWSTAFKYLMTGELIKGMHELRCEREKWLGKPSNIMRAARHYERAVQILIQNCLKDTVQFIKLQSVSCPPIGAWVAAECPARIDLQGGWTDTPPICYELGGSVVNAAVLIDGQKPIVAKARRKEEISIELIYGSLDCPIRLLIQEMSEILDFDQPFAQGALLKAALVCSGIVNPNIQLSLRDQLVKTCNSGLEVHSYSNLPHGCGMGTSSILAGAIISALWTTIGKQYDKSSVIHAVLHIEQLLTTGGGWQDQVAGVLGGVNRAFSKASLPLQVEVTPLNVSRPILELLNQHLVLVYTGKVRLAKNILQNVIRNWYARDFTIVSCFQDLIASSLMMADALVKGDLPLIGNLMNKYWNLKKVLAPGCEPSSIKLIMDTLREICYGQILVGAGGGGFMCVLTKMPHSMGLIRQLLARANILGEVSCHSVTISTEGLVVKVGT